MQVTLFGASGKVGRLVAAELLSSGYRVTVFIHKSNPLAGDQHVRVVKGDVRDTQAVAEAVKGSQVVISCLGSWGSKKQLVLSDAVRALLPTMENEGILRLITLTGSAALLPNEKVTLIDKMHRALLKTLQPRVLTDGEEHLRLLATSNLDWTTLRSPIMRPGSSQTYKLSTDRLPEPWVTVTRATVAQAIVDQMTDQTYYKRAPALS